MEVLSGGGGYLKILTVDIRTFPSRYVIRAARSRVSEYPDASAGYVARDDGPPDKSEPQKNRLPFSTWTITLAGFALLGMQV